MGQLGIDECPQHRYCLLHHISVPAMSDRKAIDRLLS